MEMNQTNADRNDLEIPDEIEHDTEKTNVHSICPAIKAKRKKWNSAIESANFG